MQERSNSWSWKLGRIAGIDVSVHFSFLIVLLIFLLDGLANGLFLIAVFGCILLHELGHALTARRFGIQTRGIILLPVGGVAQLERIPREPLQELLITVAGPAVNFALAVLLFTVLVVTRNIENALALDYSSGHALVSLLGANLFLGIVNLLPAFPMDGGRILRALLAMRLDYVRATMIASGVGRVLAVIMGIGGLLTLNFLLVAVAVFIYLTARTEAEMVRRLYSKGSAQSRLDLDDLGHFVRHQLDRLEAEKRRVDRSNMDHAGVRIHREQRPARSHSTSESTRESVASASHAGGVKDVPFTLEDC